MFHKVFFILFLMIFHPLTAYAFNQNDLTRLNDNLHKLANPYGNKVGIYFIDLQSGLELGINGSSEFPCASVGKIPIMAAAYSLADKGKINLEDKIRLDEKFKLGGSGILQWLKPGREYTIWNLIRMMIVLSDNTATKMVVDYIGLQSINIYLNEVGLQQTRIVDDTMLNELPNPKINLTSPEDIARLLLLIKQAVIFKKDSSKEMLTFMKNQRYRWGIWRGVPPGVTVANKTGNVNRVLNDAGIIYSPVGDYILSIFTNGFKKQREARLLINNISKTVYENYVPGGKVVLKVKQKKHKWVVKKGKYKTRKAHRTYRHRIKKHKPHI